jgi:two-component system NtrC family sensor kinase
MRLVRKLTLVLVLVHLVVFGLYGWRNVAHEVELFEAEAKNDARVARSLAVAAARVWRTDGKERAFEIVATANEAEESLKIRAVFLDAAPRTELAPDVDPRLFPAPLGKFSEALHVPGFEPDGDPRFYTYMRFPPPAPETAALEISRSRSLLDDYSRATWRGMLFATSGAIALSAAMSVLLGRSLVGRPARALVEMARRVGDGELGARIELPGRDELTELANEMNRMAERLSQSALELDVETRARLAALDQLRHADRLRTVGQLAAGIAHELGTPLNIVGVRASMIASGEVDGKLSVENARTIAEQTERMTKIIGQLLDFAREHHPSKAPCDLSALVRSTSTLLAPLASTRGCAITVEAPAQPLVAPVDAAQIQQALMNMVMNAVHASRADQAVTLTLRTGTAKPPVEVAGAERPCVQIAVRDEGAGIAAENLARVFEPFFTTKDVGEGTGLGLSVAHGIVQEHGGWITVASQPGAGSTFTINLPQERPA